MGELKSPAKPRGKNPDIYGRFPSVKGVWFKLLTANMACCAMLASFRRSLPTLSPELLRACVADRYRKCVRHDVVDIAAR